MNTDKEHTESDTPKIKIDVGNHKVVIQKRYEFYYNLNDILIAVWFIVGSIFFFWDKTENAGTWLFLIGSIELLIRPLIRIVRKVHLKGIHSISFSSTNQADNY